MQQNDLKKFILTNIGDIRYTAQHNFINKGTKPGQGENFVALCYIEALFDYLEKEQLEIRKISSLTIIKKDEKIKE